MGISATNPARLATAAGAAAASAPGEKFTYIYNPWGQLVEIKKIGGSTTAAKYTYSAMGHRISEQLDTNDSSNSGEGDGVVDAYDPVFFIATDPVGGGRRLATYRGTDYDPKETFIHHDARIRGPVHQGGPILRDRNADLADKPYYWASEPSDTDRYERHYYALDYRGYVSAIIAGDGKLVEQVRYSATGVPFNIPLGDVNGDGKVEAGGATDADYDDIASMIGLPLKYHVRGDLDLDGDVDAADLAIAQARDGTGTGRGRLTKRDSYHGFLTTVLEYKGENLGVIFFASKNPSVLYLRVGPIKLNVNVAVVDYPGDTPRWALPEECPDGYIYDPVTGLCMLVYPEMQVPDLSVYDEICRTACMIPAPDPTQMAPAGRVVCFNGLGIACTCKNVPWINNPPANPALRDIPSRMENCTRLHEMLNRDDTLCPPIPGLFIDWYGKHRFGWGDCSAVCSEARAFEAEEACLRNVCQSVPLADFAECQKFIESQHVNVQTRARNMRDRCNACKR